MAIEDKPSRNEDECLARLELEMVREFDRSGLGFMGSLLGFRR
jgi:hypothetical protein